MRRTLPSALAAALLLAAAAQARVVSIPAAFSAVVPQVKRRAHIAVRLPARADVDTDTTQLFASGSGRRGRYDLELPASSRCRGANACFIPALPPRPPRAPGARAHRRPAPGL